MSRASQEPINKVSENQIKELADDLLGDRDQASGDGFVDILNEVSAAILGGTPKEKKTARNALVQRLNRLSESIPFLK